MTVGEVLARIVQELTTIVHGTLNGWVNVTNAADSETGQLSFSVLPEGAGVAQWAADTMQQYANLIGGLAHIPLVGAEIARFLVVLMGMG